MKIIVLAISFAAVVLPLNLTGNFSTGLSGQAPLSLGPSLALGQFQKNSPIPIDGQPRIAQTLPTTPVRKVPAAKTVINPAGRQVKSPGKTQPQQPGQQQPGQSQQTVQEPQYQQPQPVQQLEQPLPYTETVTTAQNYQEQSIQENTSAPDTSSGTSEGFTGVQTDMNRRTGGQARGNVPGQPVQQLPVQQMPMQQGMPQQMPMMQDPQGMMQQGMPQQMPQQMPMMGQPGMSGPCTIRLSEDRSSIALVDGSGQEMNHIALGRDRVQKIFKSPDGNWNVLVFKVRQRQEYGAIAVNIGQCDPQEAREIRSMPDNIEFQGDEMLLMFPGNVVERFSLTHKTGP